MKQINIKFNEDNYLDMRAYERIKSQPGITKYIRDLVLWDINADEMLIKLGLRKGAENGKKD